MRLSTKRPDHTQLDAPRGGHIAPLLGIPTETITVTEREKAVVRDHIQAHQQPGDPDFFDMLGVTA